MFNDSVVPTHVLRSESQPGECAALQTPLLELGRQLLVCNALLPESEHLDLEVLGMKF